MNLYLKDIISLDHSFISIYGEILGNSLNVSCSIKMNEAPNDVEVLREDIKQYFKNRILGKLLIIEGYSDFVLTAPESTEPFAVFTEQVEMDSRILKDPDSDYYIDKIMDGGNVRLYSSLFQLSIDPSKISIIPTNNDWSGQVSRDYYVNYLLKPTVVSELNEYLSEKYGDVSTDVSFDKIANTTNEYVLYSYCYSKMFIDDNGLNISGYSGAVVSDYLINSVNAVKDLDGSLFVNQDDIDHSHHDDLIHSNVTLTGEYFILDTAQHLIDSNRVFKILYTDGVPTISKVCARLKGNDISFSRKRTVLLEGTMNGLVM